MKMNRIIYSFYGDVPDLDPEDQLRLTILWRERWTAAGFDPFILTEHHAAQHPFYANLVAAVSKLPTINPVNYELFCWVRWLALAVVGGGYMADLDLIPARSNITAPPAAPDPGGKPIDITIYQTPCCPSLVYATPAGIERLARAFATGIGCQPQNGRDHYSDQYAIAQLVDARQSTGWLAVVDVAKNWGDKGWSDAPFVHFASAAVAKSGLPKYKHIPIILPL